MTTTSCPTEIVTAWPAKGGREGFCPWCGRRFYVATRAVNTIALPAH